MCIPDLSDSTHSIHIYSDSTEKAYGSITYIIHYITPDPYSCNASALQIGATSLTLTAVNQKQGELYHFRKVQKDWSFCPPIIANTNTTYLYFCVWPRNLVIHIAVGLAIAPIPLQCLQKLHSWMLLFSFTVKLNKHCLSWDMQSDQSSEEHWNLFLHKRKHLRH